MKIIGGMMSDNVVSIKDKARMCLQSLKSSSANIVSIFRIFLVFISIYLVFVCRDDGSHLLVTKQMVANYGIAYYVAFILTGLAFALDGLDGYLARKFNVSSKLGATLDIMSDRIAEYSYWILFAVMGWISIVFPLIAIVRGVVVDSIRSVAASYGYTAFGEKSMQEDEVYRFICCSKFVRIWYAVAKVGAFMLIILYNVPTMDYYVSKFWYVFAATFTEMAILLCVLRGLPVIFESKKFFKEVDKEINQEVEN
ncbi:CDP-alcohol phosphatidyltransferase family protein [bacterium]|nr:CDP-alcohol phosphatidyltransferase family protein [bacterium]